MNVRRAVVAGLIGTAVMTTLLLVEPSVGLPKIAIGQILSTWLGLATAYLPAGPALGWIIHFGVGVGLALVYAGLLVGRLPGGPLGRGALFGGLVFLVAQLAFMPLVGGGIFSNDDLEMLTGSLLGHLVYGGIVGWIYGEPVAGS
jgi:uncharacterized membrane protein YagU involved in acid resistance